MARAKLTNVRKLLEHIVASVDDMIKRHNEMQPNGLRLVPIDIDNLREIQFIARAILRKHEAKHTRKDIYIER